MANRRESKLAFPSDLTQVPKVLERIVADVEAFDYPKPALFAVRLALEEALANAVKHGNKCDQAKQVRVEYVVDGERFEITVCDEGPGFNPKEVPDPTSEENLALPHGRGVMLMEAYMTEVAFNPKGNCVTLAKRIDCPLPQRD